MKCPKNKRCPKEKNSTENFLYRLKMYGKPLCNKCEGGRDKK